MTLVPVLEGVSGAWGHRGMRRGLRTVLETALGATTVLLNDFPPSEAFQEEAEELGSPSAVLSSPRPSRMLQL